MALIKASPSYYENIILNFLADDSFKVCYDIGVGPKTEYLTLKKHFPAVEFFGLEANPSTHATILGVFPGKVLQLAVSEDGGPVELVLHEANIMASGLIPYDAHTGGRRISVGSITLDEFDRSFESPDGILLWMDIEGYELKALRSGRALLQSGRVKLLNLEVRHRWNGKAGACTEADVDAFLASFGYSKVFVYNHYPASHHHDAIYVLDGHRLPAKAAPYTQLYSDVMQAVPKNERALDLALCLIDAHIAIEERDRKIGYLRSKIGHS